MAWRDEVSCLNKSIRHNKLKMQSRQVGMTQLVDNVINLKILKRCQEGSKYKIVLTNVNHKYHASF